jgi:hypothetical protein
VGWSVRAALISLSPPQWEDQATLEAGLGGAIPKGPSGDQTKSGASRSRSGCEGLIVGEHVPDRLGELSGDVDLGDPGAALAPEAFLVALVALAVGGVSEGVHRGLEHRPAQVLGALLGQWTAAVLLAGLVHAGA